MAPAQLSKTQPDNLLDDSLGAQGADWAAAELPAGTFWPQ